MTTTFDALCAQIEKEMKTQNPLVLAIDGNSASGKTTLAADLADRFCGAVIHMDDFFLPPSLRTPQRLAEPGGNVHYERFFDQIITPLQNGRTSFSWQRFDCSRMDYAREACSLDCPPLIIVEGAYSMRPEFQPAYDLTLFLFADLQTQTERILHRNGPQKLQAFLEKWIPMENRYFSHFKIREQCLLTMQSNFSQ